MLMLYLQKSVIACQMVATYNCTKREVGQIFPGQILKLPLAVPSPNLSKLNKRQFYVMLTARTKNIYS